MDYLVLKIRKKKHFHISNSFSNSFQVNLTDALMYKGEI